MRSSIPRPMNSFRATCVTRRWSAMWSAKSMSSTNLPRTWVAPGTSSPVSTTRLNAQGFWVRGVNRKRHAFFDPPADEFIQVDLRAPWLVRDVVREIDVVYQLPADDI